MTDITRREWLILTFIATYVQRTGCAPASREIAMSLGKEPGAGITHPLRSLRKKGVIAFADRRERTIHVVKGVQVGVIP